MTEPQKKLMPYVKKRVELIVAEKEAKYIRPILATETEIVAEIREDVIECMRELHRAGSYLAVNTLNSPALMKEETKE